jgi:hypothetical protein
LTSIDTSRDSPAFRNTFAKQPHIILAQQRTALCGFLVFIAELSSQNLPSTIEVLNVEVGVSAIILLLHQTHIKVLKDALAC